MLNARMIFRVTCFVAGAGCSGGALPSNATGTGGTLPSNVTGTGGQGGAPACVRVTPSIPAATGDVALDAANAQGYGLLDRLLGRYLRGDAPVYAGTASVDAPPGYPDSPTKIAAANALATLAIDSDTATLTVFSPAEMDRALFQQLRATPGITDSSLIFLDGTFPGGPSGAVCTGCIPDLFTHPSSLAWTDVVASYGGGTNDPAFDVRSTASLAAISPCELTFDQLNMVSADWPDRLQDFSAGQLDGGRLVLQKLGSVVIKNASPGKCDGLSVNYTIDLYVDPANLVDYGILNYMPRGGSLCGGAS